MTKTEVLSSLTEEPRTLAEIASALRGSAARVRAYAEELVRQGTAQKLWVRRPFNTPSGIRDRQVCAYRRIR